MKIWIVILYISVKLLLSYSLIGENICKRIITQGENIKEVIGCCNNYKERNGHCVACSPGFIGLNCTQTCPENFYGLFCKSQCTCNGAQICHRVCGCVQLSDLGYSTVTNDSTLSLDITSLHSKEECLFVTDPTSTNQEIGTSSNEILFNKPYIIGAASVICSCCVIAIGLIYRLHFGGKKEGRLNHHNVNYWLEEDQRITENSAVHTEQDEQLYGTCIYKEACYNTLTLRVDSEYPNNSDALLVPAFIYDNVYDSANCYGIQNNEIFSHIQN